MRQTIIASFGKIKDFFTQHGTSSGFELILHNTLEESIHYEMEKLREELQEQQSSMLRKLQAELAPLRYSALDFLDHSIITQNQIDNILQSQQHIHEKISKLENLFMDAAHRYDNHPKLNFFPDKTCTPHVKKNESHSNLKKTKDQEHVKMVKAIINETVDKSIEQKQKALQHIESILQHLSEPAVLQAELSGQEQIHLKAFIKDVHQQTIQTIVDSTTMFVKDVNAIFDERLFLDHFQSRESPQGSIAHPVLPELYVAAKLGHLFFPKETAGAVAFVTYGNKFLTGLSMLGSVITTHSFASIFQLGAYATPVGAMISGLSGIMGLLKSDDGNDNAIFVAMMQQIMNEIVQLRQDLREGIRYLSIVMAEFDANNARRFVDLLFMEKTHHDEIVDILTKFGKMFYINFLYLEQFQRSLNALQRYQFLQIINSADWMPIIDKVVSDCESFSTSLTVERFKDDINLLMNQLKTVQRNSMARANDINFSDAESLAMQFSTSSSLLGKKNGDSDLGENYWLGEQHIHQLIRYLQNRFHASDFSESIPTMNRIYNPAALYDITATIISLIKTYQNKVGYFGLPEQPVREALDTLTAGINNFENFLNFIAKPEVITALWNDYIKSLENFINLAKKQIEYTELKHYEDAYLKKMRVNLESNLNRLIALDNSKISEFFIMDGHNWFNFQESHWWEVYDHNGPPHWSPRGMGVGSVPHDKLKFQRAQYRLSHQQRAMNIHNCLLTHQRQQQERLERSMPNTALLNMSYKTDHAALYPFYFIGPDQTMFLVPEWYLRQIPDAVFRYWEMGYGELQFSCYFSSNNKNLNFEANWRVEEKGRRVNIRLFLQTISVFDCPINLPLLEAVHYVIYGGKMPRDTYEYDPIFQRATHGRDSSLAGFYRSAYRTTLFLPQTQDVSGMFIDATQSFTVNETFLNSWPMVKVNDTEIKQIESWVIAKKREIQLENIKNSAEMLNTRSLNAFKFDTSLPKEIQDRLMHVFNEVEIRAIILKLTLFLQIAPSAIGQDFSWPNIFRAEDILREFRSYQGGLFTPINLLESILDTLSKPEMLQKVLALTGCKKREQYPFIHQRATLDKFKEEISSHIIKNSLADREQGDVFKLLNDIALPSFKFVFSLYPPEVQIAWMRSNSDLIEMFNMAGFIGDGKVFDTKLIDAAVPNLQSEKIEKKHPIKEANIKSDFFLFPAADASEIKPMPIAEFRIPSNTFSPIAFIEGEKYFSTPGAYPSAQEEWSLPRYSLGITGQLPLVQWGLHYLFKFSEWLLPQHQQHPLSEAEVSQLNEWLHQNQQHDAQRIRLLKGYLGQTEAFSDQIHWLKNKISLFFSDCTEILEKHSITAAQFDALCSLQEKIELHLLNLSEKEIELEKFVFELQHDSSDTQSFAIRYNPVTDVLEKSPLKETACWTPNFFSANKTSTQDSYTPGLSHQNNLKIK